MRFSALRARLLKVSALRTCVAVLVLFLAAGAGRGAAAAGRGVLLADGGKKPAALAALADLAALDPAAFDRAAAAHLLNRAGFGGTPEEVEKLRALGLEKAVESLLDTTGPDPLPAFMPAVSEPLEPRSLAALSKEERQKKTRERRVADQRQLQELRAWWMRRMTLTGRPVEEKMALFLHGHFATSFRDVQNSYHMFLQNRTLRIHALGNFKRLVLEIAQDPAMLRYLNNNRNVKSAPNENFARELLELFTLGIGNYGEEDIKEAARAFTGWTLRGNEFFFAQRQHDSGEKSFLGRKGDFDGKGIVDIVFEQPAAARFIVRKLFVFFVHDEPPPETIEALAGTFRSSGFEIRPVLRQLFASAEFYSARSRGTQIKSPVDLVVGTLRLLGIDPGDSPACAVAAGQMGQELFLPPNVKGWEGGRTWVSTSTLSDRYRFSRPLVSMEDAPARPRAARGIEKARSEKRARSAEKSPAEKTGAAKDENDQAEKKKRVRLLEGAARRMPRWDPQRVSREILGEDAGGLRGEEAVDRVAARFLLVPLSVETRRELTDAYKKGSGRNRLADLIQGITSTPEYQVH